jgi:hypothetical protein
MAVTRPRRISSNNHGFSRLWRIDPVLPCWQLLDFKPHCARQPTSSCWTVYPGSLSQPLAAWAGQPPPALDCDSLADSAGAAEPPAQVLCTCPLPGRLALPPAASGCEHGPSATTNGKYSKMTWPTRAGARLHASSWREGGFDSSLTPLGIRALGRWLMRGRVRRCKSWGSPPPLCDLVRVGDRRYPWTMPLWRGCECHC